MISGAGLADAALLLVDGSPGGFEAGFYGEGAAGGAAAGFGGLGPDAPPGGQTQEHAQLARSLGVEQLAVVISKLDTCDYSQVRALPLLWPGVCGGTIAFFGISAKGYQV
jgi:elongation factor 1 alpha-like protein